jgi:hypothetical protein
MKTTLLFNYIKNKVIKKEHRKRQLNKTLIEIQTLPIFTIT